MNIERDYTRQADGSIVPKPDVNPNVVPRGYTRHADGRIMPVSPRALEQTTRDNLATEAFHKATGW